MSLGTAFTDTDTTPSSSVLAADGDELPREDRPPLPLLQNQWHEWTDYALISEDLSAGSVSAPAELVPGLESVVAEAAASGIDLKIVVTEDRAPIYTHVRDLATRLSLEHSDSTIYVAAPNYLGSYSNSIPRARLESAEDDAYRQDDAIAAAAVFEARISEPAPPWALYSAAIIVLLVAIVAGFVIANRRRAQTVDFKTR